MVLQPCFSLILSSFKLCADPKISKLFLDDIFLIDCLLSKAGM